MKAEPKSVRMLVTAPCPHCNAPLDGATSFEGATPKPGDITVCIYCRFLLAYTDGLGLRLVEPEEVKTWDRETQMQITTMVNALRELPPRPPPIKERA